VLDFQVEQGASWRRRRRNAIRSIPCTASSAQSAQTDEAIRRFAESPMRCDHRVDTSVLLDVLGADPAFGRRSAQAIRDAISHGSLIACEIVSAEGRRTL
jgi:hypothetical protein